jgi:UMF1 family MFS transporter
MDQKKSDGLELAVPLNDKKTINAWALFDWANSSYALVISVAIFPIYFLSVTSDEINLFGISVTNSGIYAFSISFAYMLVASVSPLLSGIADYSGRKKIFLKFFTTLGSLACMSMFFFFSDQSLNWLVGSMTFIIATIGFAGSLVFYNSYLPEIASEDQFDKVSAKGFAFGYVGSVILLLINLMVIQKPEWFGISNSTLPARLAFVMVGLWWLGFAQITFRRLPKDLKTPFDRSVIFHGYRELIGVWREVRKSKYIKRFLIAFFFYSAGVQTVIYLASVFAEKELQFVSSELILVIILLQVVAIGGAFFFAAIAGKKGSRVAIIAMLIIWILICTAAYFVDAKFQFYIIATAVGIVMGGIQAISRSSYSKLLPESTKDTTSYFSFYDVLEKSAIVFGTLSFGLIEQITGGMRNSVLALGLFFIVGLLILRTVNFNDVAKKLAQT